MSGGPVTRTTLMVAAIALTLFGSDACSGQEVGETVDASGTPQSITWARGQAQCDEVFSDGARYKTITTEDVYVSAALCDTGWKMRADIYVRNKGLERLDVLPDLVSLDVVGPKAKSVELQDPNALAKSLRKKAQWASFFGNLAAGLQTQRTTSTTSGTASGYAYDNQGNWASGSASGAATTETTVPDYAAQERAARQSALNVRAAEDAASYLNAVALKANTIGPGEGVYGAVFFERTKGPEVLLRVRLAGTTYEFPFVRLPKK